MGASTPLRRVTYCCHLLPFLSCAGCYTGSRSGCLTQLQCLFWYDGSFLFILQSDEVVLQGHLSLQAKSLSPTGPCCYKLPFFCMEDDVVVSCPCFRLLMSDKAHAVPLQSCARSFIMANCLVTGDFLSLVLPLQSLVYWLCVCVSSCLLLLPLLILPTLH